MFGVVSDWAAIGGSGVLSSQTVCPAALDMNLTAMFFFLDTFIRV